MPRSRAVAAGRRLDGEVVERVIFALVAQRALEPGSKLAATGWVAQRVAIGGCGGLRDDQAYRGMDFLLEALPEIASEIFASVAHLRGLDLDIVFVDTTSTYWEAGGPDLLPELQDDGQGEANQDGGDGEVVNPLESGRRAFGHSKDFRSDLPQVVIAMAVTRDGSRCGAGPSPATRTTRRSAAPSRTTSGPGTCAGWCGSPTAGSPPPRTGPTRARVAGTTSTPRSYTNTNTNTEAAAALARPGRHKAVAGNLRVKEVHVAPGGRGDGDGGARTQRFVVCHNPEQAERDAAVRTNLIEHLSGLIAGSDTWTPSRRSEFIRSWKAKPGLRRYLRATKAGLLRIDQNAAKREAHLDGKWLLRTSDLTLTPEDLAAAHKQLLAVERGWRNKEGALGLRPVFHHRDDRIRGHVQLCWLALLLIRVIENATGDTWRNLSHELDRMHLVTLATPDGTVAQRSATTPGQKTILEALQLPEPPRFFNFTIPTE